MKRLLPLFLLVGTAHAAPNTQPLPEWRPLHAAMRACEAQDVQTLARELQKTWGAHPAKDRALTKLPSGLWEVTLFESGMGRWAQWGDQTYLIDPKTCAALGATSHGVFSDATYHVRFHEAGAVSPALRRRLRKHLGLHEGGKNAQTNLGAYAIARRWGPSRALVHEGVERRVRTSNPSPWTSGRPRAQRKTVWPVPGTQDGKVVVGTKKPERWKRLGRYDLYRYDGGMRFRRGHEALAVYDRTKKRHAWVLLTPLDQDSQGRVTLLGHRDSLVWLTVGPRLLAIDAACATLHEVEGGEMRGGYERLKTLALPVRCARE